MSTFLTFSFHHYINYSACVTKNFGVIVYIVATSCDHACDCHTVATSPHKCDYTHCMQTHNHYGICLVCMSSVTTTMCTWFLQWWVEKGFNSSGVN